MIRIRGGSPQNLMGEQCGPPLQKQKSQYVGDGIAFLSLEVSVRKFTRMLFEIDEQIGY